MRKAQDRVTIGDVAAEAGVSIATVSRVVNGHMGGAQHLPRVTRSSTIWGTSRAWWRGACEAIAPA